MALYSIKKTCRYDSRCSDGSILAKVKTWHEEQKFLWSLIHYGQEII